MARILAIDFGRRRIGLAVCDPLQIAVRGLPTLEVANIGEAVGRVVDIIKAEAADKVIVGLPLNMDGSRGEMASAAEEFAAQIDGLCSVSVQMLDERLSSVGAQNEMRAMGIKTGKKKGTVDRVAAELILETYLQQLGS